MDVFDWVPKPGDLHAWPALLHTSLFDSISRYRDLLLRNKRRGDLDYIAWLTRNLIELRVWVEYCSISQKNAEDFLHDAVRDLVDLNRTLGGLDDPETIKNLHKAKAYIGTDRAAHKYKHVADAAEEVGMKTVFVHNCKMLSKLVHPTAVSVLAPIPGQAADMIRRQFVELGRLQADEALQKLDSSHMGDAHRKYRQFINGGKVRS